MRVRLYEPSDAPALDRLLNHNQGHDVRLDHDRVIVAGDPVSALLVWRPTAIIHELVLPRTLGIGNMARNLVLEACADSQRSLYRIRVASFMIDPSNASMVRYVRDLKAVEEARQLWTIPIFDAKRRIENARPGLHR
jgi:hypothetical protein